ncbi:MAG: methyltransferase domain-containing protein [Candidatus Latescibacteria bacterium]|nr:methyltransferase domain-containing protein [Candidatus Latescibacterota bacterium]
MEKEKYQMGYSEELLKVMSNRSISYEAAHIAKLIQPGMKLLDIGCGPGSMTLDFAELVQTGQVTGLDVNDEQFDRPRRLAKERGLNNIEFRCGDAYALPFDDNVFDIVTENAMLMHLSEPNTAIAEMKRVLKPGGYVGLRDLYVSGSMIYSSAPCPTEGGFQRINAVQVEIERQHGADFDAGIKHRFWLKTAGFAGVEVGISPSVLASDEQWQVARENAELSARNWNRISQQAIDLDLLTPNEASEYKAWQDGLRSDPAAINVRMWFHATGQKPL